MLWGITVQRRGMPWGTEGKKRKLMSTSNNPSEKYAPPPHPSGYTIILHVTKPTQ